MYSHFAEDYIKKDRHENMWRSFFSFSKYPNGKAMSHDNTYGHEDNSDIKYEHNSAQVVDDWELSPEQSTSNTMSPSTSTLISRSYFDLYLPSGVPNSVIGYEDMTLTIPSVLRELDPPNNIPENNDHAESNVDNNGMISTALTTVATSNNISQLNATPDYVDKGDSEYHWLTDSISFIRCNPFYLLECVLKETYMIIKLENIPWAVSVNEINKEFEQFHQPPPEKHNTHIMMDICSGKTGSKAFIQVTDCTHNRQLVEEKQTTHIIRGRRIKATICSEDEFLMELYPSWPGTFQDGHALLPANNTNMHPAFISQRELQSLANVCKMYKQQFNRKSGERPFDYMKSIILNLPWHQERAITTAQRDILYESYKITTRYLAEHSKKPNTPFTVTSVDQYVRPALLCCGFTPKQRRAILKEGNLSCPPELAYSIEDPVFPQLEDRTD